MYPLRPALIVLALWLCLKQCHLLWKALYPTLVHGKEPVARRLRSIAHTFVGAYYAVLLRRSAVQHIHVHHGYFGSWVAMIAARLLTIDFSMTLHGSDLLLNPAFLDLKLELCQTCFTISEFNRRHLLATYPRIDPRKIVVQHIGVDCQHHPPLQEKHDASKLAMFTAGRLHAVKDHSFLIRAAAVLRNRGFDFTCSIAGEGPERQHLEQLIQDLGLNDRVSLLGQLSPENMAECYGRADLIVLTSRSEGIPLVLMEAMAQEKVVLAPAITGIPELVRDGETGFLYRPGSLEDFVNRVEMFHKSRSGLGALRQAAARHVAQHFNKQKNLDAFCDRLLASIGCVSGPCAQSHAYSKVSYENPILQ